MLRRYLLIICLSMAPIAHAQSFYPIRHVIANETGDTLSYRFRLLEDNACDTNDFIKPHQLQQMNCHKQGNIFTIGVYRLDFEQIYFHGKRIVHCSSTRMYPMRRYRRLVIWRVYGHCQVDIIEA